MTGWASRSVILAALTAAYLPAAAEDRVAAGLIRAEQEATIAAPVAARITDLPLRAGEAFAEGDLLVAFDCAPLRAEIEEAKASRAAAGARLSVNRELDKYNAVGTGELNASRAEAAAAAARVEALTEQAALCQIDAPFSGKIARLDVNRYETPSQNQALMHILDDTDLRIEIIAPSVWLRWIKIGARLSFQVRETGTVHKAKIERIGAAIDPVSQSIDLVASFVETPQGVLPGMSGQALFDDQ